MAKILNGRGHGKVKDLQNLILKVLNTERKWE